MVYRSRCLECGHVFPKPTKRKRCPECKAFGFIKTFSLYNIEDCPLCSNIINNKTQHDPKDEFCPLCNSYIAIEHKEDL